VLGILTVSHHLIKHTSNASADISVRDILCHVLLIHNLFAKYNMALDGPMWSVAWEWQIYFIFALVLLPVWRRYGIVWTTILGFVIGFLPMMFLQKGANFNWTSPWYVGLFAFGMAAAVVTCNQDDRYRYIKTATLQNLALSVIASGMLIIAIMRPQWLESEFTWIVDIFVGAFTALFILACANKPCSSRLQQTIVHGLQARSTMMLGAFSYSLYLVHYPILQKMHDMMHSHHFSHYLEFVILFFVGVPFCLCVAYLFHLAFERPFMPGRPKTERQAEAAAIVSPAP
jgi:peptidoglycan/LPS O-acetylase OafA/YrhL